ncbi:MAG: integration host factor subunit alpha [SAR116 cluster bacterium]|nr:integration host factor subunit alpha [SAR116 cluster bacterium]RPH11533.1 MAG: integration host factor subunit alpha [Alphaproteobacteria bacterium TMED54]|tara:strand:- start:426 stop:710 length:285 start_codon:yes stop_codon:yes gene_type:complete
MTKTWTRNDIIEQIQIEMGISISDSSKIFEEIIEEVLLSLEEGNDVKISNFGTFSVKKKKSRIGRNPKTGVEKEITARNVISFYPSKSMKIKIS